MAGGRVEMRIEGAARLRDVAAQLKAADRKDLRKHLLKRIRDAGKPAVEDVRAAVRATPSKGGRSTAKTRGARRGRGLRAAIAAATQVSVGTGKANPSIRIRVSGARFKSESSPATLPKYLDGELNRFRDGRWRHPTFGHKEWKDGRSAWQPQAAHPYFFVTIRRHRDDFRKAVLKAIDDTLDDLGRG